MKRHACARSCRPHCLGELRVLVLANASLNALVSLTRPGPPCTTRPHFPSIVNHKFSNNANCYCCFFVTESSTSSSSSESPSYSIWPAVCVSCTTMRYSNRKNRNVHMTCRNCKAMSNTCRKRTILNHVRAAAQWKHNLH